MSEMNCGCCFCVSTATLGIVESLGKFAYIAEPGLTCLNPCTEQLSGRVSLRVTPIGVDCPSKTKDNVVVSVSVVVQYRVLPNKVTDAFYRFSNPSGQISSYVTNVIRGQVPQHTLDELFLQRDEMQVVLKEELDSQLEKFGFVIVAALICDINPARNVQDAMNQINTNARLKIAQQHKSEAEKYEVVKAAEADAEAKRLSGVGLAEQRKAAILGLQSSVEDFQSNVPDMTSKDIMSLLLMNQYFDAVKDIAESGKATTIFTSQGQDTAMAESMLAVKKH